MVNVGGITVRQTIGLATSESTQFGSSPADGLFGLGFDSIESVSGVRTFMDNAIAAGVLAQPVVSVFLPSERRFNGLVLYSLTQTCLRLVWFSITCLYYTL
jgi:hypothetical protein